MLIDREPLLPTLYRVLCHDATLIDCEGEALYPRGTQLEFTVTTLVIWLPRQAVGPRCRRSETERRRGCVVSEVMPTRGCDQITCRHAPGRPGVGPAPVSRVPRFLVGGGAYPS